MNKKKALIAMSGGVDSSVALYLMMEQGYECIGVTLKLYNGDDMAGRDEKTCCSLRDVEDARSVAYSVGIPYYVFNFEKDFKSCVIDRFINAYESGETPNPCIDCNRHMKFEKLLERAVALGIDTTVTGHYARVAYSNKRYLLKKAIDTEKDQSYVLYSLTQKQLAHTAFPLGELSKRQVREIAEEHGFRNANKRDSQDICFVPDGDYAGFIKRSTGKEYAAGDFIGTDGNVLGRHEGLIRYTIGQRKGLRIALGHPMYVCEKNVRDNTVTLSDNDGLYSKRLRAGALNLIACDSITSPIRVRAKTRYSQLEQEATAEQTAPDRLHIEFDSPQRAITRGQAVVMYDGDTVIGGGTIL